MAHLDLTCTRILGRAQVEEFVAACKYPPQGSRSFGPGRGHFVSPYVSTHVPRWCFAFHCGCSCLIARVYLRMMCEVHALLCGCDSFRNYREIANDSIATLAMIETRKAIDNLHKIVAVKGLDAVFIGTYIL